MRQELRLLGARHADPPPAPPRFADTQVVGGWSPTWAPRRPPVSTREAYGPAGNSRSAPSSVSARVGCADHARDGERARELHALRTRFRNMATGERSGGEWPATAGVGRAEDVRVARSMRGLSSRCARALRCARTRHGPSCYLGIVEGFPQALVYSSTLEPTARDLENALEEYLGGRRERETTRSPVDDFAIVRVVRLRLSTIVT